MSPCAPRAFFCKNQKFLHVYEVTSKFKEVVGICEHLALASTANECTASPSTAANTSAARGASMRFRRLFGLGATAALSVTPASVTAWCSPKKVRDGVDADGRLKYESEHLKIFGKGFHFSVFWKAKIVQMWENSETFYDEREQRKKMPTIHEFFHNITGFGHQRVGEYQKEIEENDGFLLPPNQRGKWCNGSKPYNVLDLLERNKELNYF